jgi:hypothetical protein
MRLEATEQAGKRVEKIGFCKANAAAKKNKVNLRKLPQG